MRRKRFDWAGRIRELAAKHDLPIDEKALASATSDDIMLLVLNAFPDRAFSLSALDTESEALELITNCGEVAGDEFSPRDVRVAVSDRGRSYRVEFAWQKARTTLELNATGPGEAIAAFSQQLPGRFVYFVGVIHALLYVPATAALDFRELAETHHKRELGEA